MFKTKNIKKLWKLICFYTYLLFFLLCILSINSFANQSDVSSSTPEDVVKKFCQLDAEGKRLRSDTWNSILPFVIWTEEAGDMIFVISNFKVGKAVIADSVAKVPVEYYYLGSTNAVEFSEIPPKKTTSYIYKLVKQNGMWKIQEPVSAPHVHWKAVITHLMEIQRREPARKEQLELIIQKIRKAGEKLKK